VPEIPGAGTRTSPGASLTHKPWADKRLSAAIRRPAARPDPSRLQGDNINPRGYCRPKQSAGCFSAPVWHMQRSNDEPCPSTCETDGDGLARIALLDVTELEEQTGEPQAPTALRSSNSPSTFAPCGRNYDSNSWMARTNPPTRYPQLLRQLPDCQESFDAARV
jgi:hypothetical protein